jgi:FAD/FMN-containing dehydrogenase
MTGNVVLPEDGTPYQNCLKIWNGAPQRHPALFAVCKKTQDVVAAVRVARDHGFPISVRAGGHDWAGRALRDDALVIDLTEMRGIEVDTGTRMAACQGGARGLELSDATTPHGLVGMTGNCGPVGLGGLYLGGGYCPLTPKYGLAADNLLGADLVLADGRAIRVSSSENSELLWALRGGGGNFGVVTSLSVRLQPAAPLLAGIMLFPLSDAPTVLRGYATLMAQAGDELAMGAGMLCGPDGTPAAFVAPVWNGDLARGEELIRELRSLGTPLLEHVGVMAYGELVRMYDDYTVNGRHYDIQTRWMPDLTAEMIELLVRAGRHMTSPFSIINIQHLHGAATRVHPDSTAFAQRRKHFLIETIVAWEPSSFEKGEVHRQWGWNLTQAMTPYSLAGAYPNILGPQEGERARLAFGNNLRRLQEVKRKYDPEGVFAPSIPLVA